MANEDSKTAAAENAEGAEQSPEELAAKKKKKRLIIIIAAAVLVVGAGGGAAAFFMMGSSDSTGGEAGTQPAAGEHGEGTAADAAAKADEPKKEGEEKEGAEDGKDEKATAAAVTTNFGATYQMKPFHLNLGNPLENRFIRMEISLEYLQGDEQSKEIARRMPQLRDAVIAVTTRKSREFLLGPDGKNQLRLEILNRINHYMDRKIDNVYITDIIIE